LRAKLYLDISFRVPVPVHAADDNGRDVRVLVGDCCRTLPLTAIFREFSPLSER
jgi:hypothetical protein